MTVVSVKDQIKHVGLVQSKHHHHFNECNLFSPRYS